MISHTNYNCRYISRIRFFLNYLYPQLQTFFISIDVKARVQNNIILTCILIELSFIFVLTYNNQSFLLFIIIPFKDISLAINNWYTIYYQLLPIIIFATSLPLKCEH